MRIQANNACYRAENACGQSKRCNKARHVSKKECHFLRPTLMYRTDLQGGSLAHKHECLLRLPLSPLRAASGDTLKHKRGDLWPTVRLWSTALNVCLVSREHDIKTQRL